MRYTGILLAVKDMETSKRFYHDVLGLDVVADFGANVTLTGGIALQTLETCSWTPRATATPGPPARDILRCSRHIWQRHELK